METPKDRELQLKWEESIRKIKEYLDSLTFEKTKKNIKHISDPTSKELDKALTQDKQDETAEDEQDKITEDGKQWSPEGFKWGEDESWNDNWETGWNGWNSWEKEEKWEFEIPPEDQDEYIPRDSEFGEAMWEQSRFAEIYPPFLWYYVQWKKSYFDREKNLWSKKKQLKPFSHKLPEWIKTYTYTWVIANWKNAIPLPDLAWPDTGSLCVSWKSIPEFQIDQNGCVYLISTEKQFVSFNFWLNQHTNDVAPIDADSEKIIFDSLSSETQELLRKLKASWASAREMAAAIKYYIIKNKKYSTKVQGTLRDKSNKDNYIKHLDESPILECFSANSLCVALCRELWIPARLVVWHMIQSVNNEWKACITKNDGHAWSEIWDDTIWERIRVDATPTQKEDWKDSNENGQEQNNNNNQDADNNFWDDQNQQSWDKWQDSETNDKWQKSNEWKDDWEKSWEDKWQKDWEQEPKSDSQSDNKPDSKPNSDTKSDDNSTDQNEEPQEDSPQSKSPQNDKWKLRKPNSNQPQKSPEELLDEMIEKAKEDSLLQQSDKLKDTLDKLEKAKTKEDIKDILDKAWLSDFAKNMVDKLGKDKILEEEKEELESLDDENKIDEALENSLLDENYKQKLRDYAKLMKKKIEEERKKMKSEMERMWFAEHELRYYKEYKELEAEVEPEVKKQIRELQKILPVEYQIVKDDTQHYKSWIDIDWSKLLYFRLTWDSKIFIRNKEVRQGNEINMFETIIIDTSWSMGSFGTPWSILRESVKAAIIRAKVLEHFKVDFSIVLFGSDLCEVMRFGEKFSSKWKCNIPAKLIRAIHTLSWGCNSSEPISYVYQNMMNQLKKHHWKSFGNISFIWDWDLYSGTKRPDLKDMIDRLKQSGFWVTAYYINDSWSNLIDYYFGKPEDWGAVYALDSKELAMKIIEAHKTHLKKKIKKYIK